MSTCTQCNGRGLEDQEDGGLMTCGGCGGYPDTDWERNSIRVFNVNLAEAGEMGDDLILIDAIKTALNLDARSSVRVAAIWDAVLSYEHGRYR